MVITLNFNGAVLQLFLYQGYSHKHEPKIIMKVLALFAMSMLKIPISNKVNGSGLIDDSSDTVNFRELNKDYRIYQKRLTWDQSLQFCSKCIGSFATFENRTDIRKIEEAIYNISVFNKEYDSQIEPSQWGLDRRYWIGLTDAKSESNWTWIKSPDDPGTPAVEISKYNWYTGQPDHFISGESEHCAGFWNPVYYLDKNKTGEGKRREVHFMNDYPCDNKMYFICKTGENMSSDGICKTWEHWINISASNALTPSASVGRSINRVKLKSRQNSTVNETKLGSESGLANSTDILAGSDDNSTSEETNESSGVGTGRSITRGKIKSKGNTTVETNSSQTVKEENAVVQNGTIDLTGNEPQVANEEENATVSDNTTSIADDNSTSEETDVSSGVGTGRSITRGKFKPKGNATADTNSSQTAEESNAVRQNGTLDFAGNEAQIANENVTAEDNSTSEEANESSRVGTGRSITRGKIKSKGNATVDTNTTKTVGDSLLGQNGTLDITGNEPEITNQENIAVLDNITAVADDNSTSEETNESSGAGTGRSITRGKIKSKGNASTETNSTEPVEGDNALGQNGTFELGGNETQVTNEGNINALRNTTAVAEDNSTSEEANESSRVGTGRSITRGKFKLKGNATVGTNSFQTVENSSQTVEGDNSLGLNGTMVLTGNEPEVANEENVNTTAATDDNSEETDSSRMGAGRSITRGKFKSKRNTTAETNSSQTVEGNVTVEANSTEPFEGGNALRQNETIELGGNGTQVANEKNATSGQPTLKPVVIKYPSTPFPKARRRRPSKKLRRLNITESSDEVEIVTQKPIKKKKKFFRDPGEDKRKVNSEEFQYLIPDNIASTNDTEKNYNANDTTFWYPTNMIRIVN